jgi:hypothetical protein
MHAWQLRAPQTAGGDGDLAWLRLSPVSRSDDHWLGRAVMTVGVATSSTTVVLLIVLLLSGRS